MFKKSTATGIWLAIGLVAGISISYFWPHEPVEAAAVDHASKFSLMTTPVSFTSGTEGVFCLDYLTGQLRGAVINTKNGKFTNFYFRNLAADFNVDPKSQPQYTMVGGNGQIVGGGGLTMATSVVYVGELASGTVVAYALPFRESTFPLKPVELTPVDRFQFREAIQRN